MKRLTSFERSSWGFVFHQSSVVRPPGTRSSQGEESCAALKRKAPSEILNVCIASVGFRRRHRRQPTLADTNRQFGEQGGRRASGVSCFSCERALSWKHLQSLIRSCAAQRATLFNGSPIPVTARFSDGSGCRRARRLACEPRGIAIKYHLAGGGDTDMVTNSFKFFPVGTGEDFRDLLQAITESPPDAPHPNKVEQFFGSHPSAPKAIGSLPIPDSFADEEYHALTLSSSSARAVKAGSALT